jgi:hypothetical protein
MLLVAVAILPLSVALAVALGALFQRGEEVGEGDDFVLQHGHGGDGRGPRGVVKKTGNAFDHAELVFLG